MSGEKGVDKYHVSSQEELDEALDDYNFNAIVIEEKGEYEVEGIDIRFAKFVGEADEVSIILKDCKVKGRLRFKSFYKVSIHDSEASFLTFNKVNKVRISNFKLEEDYLETVTPFTISDFDKASIHDVYCKGTSSETDGVGISLYGDKSGSNKVVIDSCIFEGLHLGVRLQASDAKIINSKFLDSETGIEARLNSDIKIVDLEFENVEDYLEIEDSKTSLEIEDTPEIILNNI